VQGLPEEEPGEQRIDQDGAVAVVPVEGEQAALSGPQARGLAGQLRVERGVAAANLPDPPFEDVAHRGLSGLDPVEAREDGAGHDAADAGDVGNFAAARDDGAVAGRGADHLDQRALGDAAADRAVVHVERAGGQDDARFEPEPARPGRAEGAGRRRGVLRFVIKPVAQAGQRGVEQGEEFLVRQPAPFVAVEGLVPGGADAAANEARVGHAGQDGGDPVGQFDPGVGGAEDGGGGAAAVPDFAPEPFGGVGVAAFGDVVWAAGGGQPGDAGRFPPRGVVFPQPALCRGVAAPARLQAEGAVLRVDGDGAGSGGIDAEAPDVGGVEAGPPRGLAQGAADRFLQGGKVIAGVLARHVVVARVENDAFASGGIARRGAPHFSAVAAADNQGAHRVGAEVEPESQGIGVFHAPAVARAVARPSSNSARGR